MPNGKRERLADGVELSFSTSLPSSETPEGFESLTYEKVEGVTTLIYAPSRFVATRGDQLAAFDAVFADPEDEEDIALELFEPWKDRDVYDFHKAVDFFSDAFNDPENQVFIHNHYTGVKGFRVRRLIYSGSSSGTSYEIGLVCCP